MEHQTRAVLLMYFAVVLLALSATLGMCTMISNLVRFQGCDQLVGVVLRVMHAVARVFGS